MVTIDNKVWPLRTLWVDLTKNETRKRLPTREHFEKYLGGRGFNSRLLFDLLKPEIDALSPANVLLFGIGPLVGTLAPGSCKLTVTSKSPLTDIFGDSTFGGYFGPELRLAGYSQIVFLGKAEKPVYLWIDDDHAEIRDATHLWGKNTWDTPEAIVEELGDPTIQVACIGPAGENLVRFACIISGLSNAAGRCGMGAVMGSKNLKAVAVRGTKDISVVHPEVFEEASRIVVESIKKGYNYETFSSFGTPWFVEPLNLYGSLAMWNYRSNTCPFVDMITGRVLRNNFTLKMRTDFACPVSCKHFYAIKKGKYAGTRGEGPDFGHTQAAIQLDIPSMEWLLFTNNLLNQYGIDEISFYINVMWAMDCYERGIINKEETGDLVLEWGNENVVNELIHLIARRKGFGKILAEGEKRASKIVGKGSDKYIHHVKGMGPVIEDPRAIKNLGSGYYTATRGGDHLKSYYSTVAIRALSNIIEERHPYIDLSALQDPGNSKGKGIGLPWCENYSAVLDCCGLCKFAWVTTGPMPYGPVLEGLTKLLWAGVGLKMGISEILRLGERVYNVEKAFNSREGLTRKDDDFSNPEKFTIEAIPDGPAKGKIFERDQILDAYYETRGWDKKTGLQRRRKLEELELKDIADVLEKVDCLAPK